MTANTHATGTDRVAEVADKIPADWYINVQGDEPIIEPQTIKSVLPTETEKSQIITVKTKISNPTEVLNFNVVKAITSEDDRAIFFTRTAAPFPKSGENYAYYKHLGLYAFTRDALLFFKNTPQGAVEKIEEIELLRFIEHGWHITGNTGKNGGNVAATIPSKLPTTTRKSRPPSHKSGIGNGTNQAKQRLFQQIW